MFTNCLKKLNNIQYFFIKFILVIFLVVAQETYKTRPCPGYSLMYSPGSGLVHFY